MMPNRKFFVVAGLIYAIVNDQGKLFISGDFEANPLKAPELLAFDKKIQVNREFIVRIKIIQNNTKFFG